MKTNRHLVVFARRPDLGLVKTRLAADIGLVAATRFYRQTSAAVMNRLGRDNRWRCWAAVTPATAIHGHRFWPRVFEPIAQGTGNLGARMGHVLGKLPPGPAVIIGTDVPAIRPRHIESAFRALGDHDAVFGPSGDGGYWLVGARRSPHIPDLFSGVRWSSRHTLADSLLKLEGQGVKVALIEELADIDTGDDYHRWVNQDVL